MQEQPKKKQPTWLGCLVAMSIIGMLVYLLLYLFLFEVMYAREAGRCMRCCKYMEQIGIALHKYKDKNGHFPPAYTVDANGNPLHSWRVLILPYLDDEAFNDPKWKQRWREIYDHLRLDEPWNSEHNQKLFRKYEDDPEETQRLSEIDIEKFAGSDMCLPLCFQCPNLSNAFVTVYKMPVGENAVGHSAGTALSDIKRPLDKTILIIESEPAVLWYCPIDFPADNFKDAVMRNEEKADELHRGYEYPHDAYRDERWQGNDYKDYELTKAFIKQVPYPLIGGHYRELHVLFCDGTVKSYKDWRISKAKVEAMCRIRE